jgi:hypothetical protein
MRTASSLLRLLVVVTGCATSIDGEEDGLGEEEVAGGAPTWARPEIGQYVPPGATAPGCGATLVGPRTAVTAAHCIPGDMCGTADGVRSADFGRFRVHLDAEVHHDYPVDLAFALDSTADLDICGVDLRALIEDVLERDIDLDGDLALLHLAQAVDPAQATPTRLSTKNPDRQGVTGWGFGCDQRGGILGGDKGAGVKRSASWIWGRDEGDNGCAGDWGGPVTIGADGPVVAVHAARVDLLLGAHTYRAHVWEHIGALEQVIESWDCADGDHCSNGVQDCGEVRTDACQLALRPAHAPGCALGVVGGGDGADVVQTCGAETTAAWTLALDWKGRYEVHGPDGRCLEIIGWSEVEGGDAVQYSCHGGDNQKWWLDPNEDGSFQLVNEHSGKCLDVYAGSAEAGADVIQWSCSGNDNQRWYLEG